MWNNMKKTSGRRYLLAGALLLALTGTPCRADNNTIAYSHDTGKGTKVVFGNGKTETYDVAIRMDGKAVRGLTIESVRIPLGSMKHISNLKVWLSKKLNLRSENGKKVNSPDILSQEAEAGDSSMAEVRLAQPYTIDCDTVFVGYSFSIDKADASNKRPFGLTSEKHDGGFWLHSSQTYNRTWTDYSDKGSSTLQVMLAGAPADAATVAHTERPYSLAGQASSMVVTLANRGYRGIQSIDYSYEEGPLNGTGHLDLETGVPAVYEATANVQVPLPAIDGKGVYPVKVTIDRVNGGDNADTARQATTEIDVYDKLPTHRAVLEEYTGTWCGNCPRGFVGMEVMKRLYPNDFIGISYHNNDPMEIMASSLFPSNVQKGLPDSWLDRTYETDAYFGAGSKGFGIDKMWSAVCGLLAQADITVKGKLTDDDTRVEMEADVAFPLPTHDADCHVEFVLLADSLHGDGSKWAQTNYFADRYSGGEDVFPEPEFKKFYDGKDPVAGLYYNDVVIASSRLNGTDVQLPATFEAGVPVKATASFDLSKAVNTSGESLVQSLKDLYAVALLVRADGSIVNGAKAAVPYRSAAGISSLPADSTATPAAIYDLTGRRLEQVKRGFNLVKMSDGQTVKILRK